MKVLITEDQLMDVWKKSFRKIWDKRGYASIDENLMKLMRMPMSFHHHLEGWVLEWNEEHNINPLKYFEEDGYKFNQSTSSPHLYMSKDYIQITLSDGNLSGDIRFARIDVNTKDKDVTVWIDIDFSTIVDGGRTFDELYPVENDDDDYFAVVNEYRDEFLWLTAKHFQKNYTDKMGYLCEIEFD
jgi:hypothetical protein